LKQGTKTIRTILSINIGLIHLITFYIVITTSLKEAGDFSSKLKTPTSITWTNFVEAWEKANLCTALTNPAIITVFAAILLIILGSMATYPLARRRTRLTRFVFLLFISIMVIPTLTALVPLYHLLVAMGMLK